jgi:hypothetical protein
MKMLAWLVEWCGKRWRARQRKIDLKILWPLCKEMAEDLDQAKAAFMMHANHDEAWTADFTEAELVTYISNLR